MDETKKNLKEFADKNDLRDHSLRSVGQLISPEDPIHPQRIKQFWISLFKEGEIPYLPERTKSNPFIKIQIRGYADCGVAQKVANDEELGELVLSKNFLGSTREGAYFAVIASGESMNEAKGLKGGPINNGDYVIVDSTARSPSNGDYVVTIVDNLANIKRFYKEDDRIVLKSESSDESHQPIILGLDDFALISGTVKQVVRKPKTISR